ncbi:MAG: nitrilase-related carbon-nitrogen hydrolase [Phycisphaerales bacterium]|jgi:predicted amidohydrolase|nr:nitrilase-related carbon-nitrogen hydrolase [Phycisphaerales bacterium]
MLFHALQFNAKLHNIAENRTVVERMLNGINTTKDTFVVLQEMTDTGWSMKLDRITNVGTVDWACELAKTYGCWIQVGWTDNEGAFGKNCVTICSPSGERVGTYTKVFTCNPMCENEYFKTGDSLLIVDIGGVKICPSICYDIRFPELWRPAAAQGVDVFTVSSSWPLVRIAHWEILLRARAIENQAYVVASNRIGKDAVSEWGGTSLILSHMGEILSKGSETETECISSTLDLTRSNQWKKEFAAIQDIQKDLLGTIKVTKIKA